MDFPIHAYQVTLFWFHAELADTKEKLHEVHRKLSVANQTIASLRGGVRQPDSPSPEGLVHIYAGAIPMKGIAKSIHRH